MVDLEIECGVRKVRRFGSITLALLLAAVVIRVMGLVYLISKIRCHLMYYALLLAL